MKHHLGLSGVAPLLVAMIISAPHVSCADSPAPLLAVMQPAKTGTFTVDDLAFSVFHKSDKWANTSQTALTVADGFPQATDSAFMTQGSFKTPSGVYSLVEKLTANDRDAVAYDAALSGAPSAATNVLCLLIDLPVSTYKGQHIQFDDKPYDLPWWFRSEGIANIQHAHTLRIPLRHGGTLVLTGDISAYVQDIRAYGSEHYNIQIGFDPSKGPITASHLALTFGRLADGATAAIAFDPNAHKPVLPPPPDQLAQTDPTDTAAATDLRAHLSALPAVHPQGEAFVDASGKSVRFWGVNLVAYYPDHALADKTAENIASLGVNIVRPHHNLRNSRDWDPADTASLLTYQADSRTPNLKAWDRYDYLNAKLRQKGIYLAVSIHGTRDYSPYDVAIQHVSADDDAAWQDAIDEMNHWPWQKVFDPRKMLPVIDDRCFQLNAEYATRLLKHVNPYTGLAYGADPQTLSVEMVNEFSSEYTLVCKNVFPAYFTTRLNARLADYCKAKGMPAFGLYEARSPQQVKTLSDFCNDLDRSYAQRMTKVLRDAGYAGPVELSNLWRGDANLRVRVQTGGLIEDHAYEDPLVTDPKSTFLAGVTRSSVVGKPVVIGEFNHSENQALMKQRMPNLSMLPAAVAAYGSLHGDAGIVWFAWAHGILAMAPDGWGKKRSAHADNLGVIADGGPILDQFRAAGVIFKNGYLSESTQPQTIVVDDSYFPNGYADLMAGQTTYANGWQFVHAFRKTFGPIPPTQTAAPWRTTPPADPTVSDTGQIVRNAARRQLSFAAAKCEGFSGYLDGKAADRHATLSIAGDAGFATVLVVALDDQPLAQSRRLLVSKSYTDANGAESPALSVTLSGLVRGAWTVTQTLPDRTPPTELAQDASGTVTLPPGAWNECEVIAK